ncbi:hypothetical protein MRX96_001856 [Rhipicephalus microplus]
MSFSGLAPPPPFLPTPGWPSLPWDEWEQTLTVYLLASGAAEFPPARRKPILMHCLGGGRAACLPDFTCRVKCRSTSKRRSTGSTREASRGRY